MWFGRQSYVRRSPIKTLRSWLGMVAQTYNPSTLGGQVGQITYAREFETSLGNMVKPQLYKECQKLARCGGVPCSPSYLGG